MDASSPIEPPRAVDVHAHLFPQSAVRAERRGTSWFGSEFDAVGPDEPPVVWTHGRRSRMGTAIHREPPEDRLRRMRAMGVCTQVVSVLPPLFRYDIDIRTAADAARSINDEIAAMVEVWPGSFLGLATLPLQDVRASLDEFERAMSTGHSGIAIGTHVAGRDLDDVSLRPIFRRASEYQAFVLVHPVHPRAEALQDFYLSNVLGNPMETTIAYSRMVLGGVFDDAPGMRACFCHGGGYIGAAVGRLDHAYAVRKETTGCVEPPSSYLDRVYVDSLTHDRLGLADLVTRVGASRVLLGSDYPADMGAAEPVRDLFAAALPRKALEAVAWGNAESLFGSLSGTEPSSATASPSPTAPLR